MTRRWSVHDPIPADQPTVRDNQGDVWSWRADGLLETPETKPFPWAHVVKKWGPLVEVVPVAARREARDVHG